MLTIQASIQDVASKLFEWANHQAVGEEEQQLRSSLLTYLERAESRPLAELIPLIEPVCARIEDCAIEGLTQEVSEYVKVLEAVYTRTRICGSGSTEELDLSRVKMTFGDAGLFLVRGHPQFVIELFNRLADLNDRF